MTNKVTGLLTLDQTYQYHNCQLKDATNSNKQKMKLVRILV